MMPKNTSLAFSEFKTGWSWALVIFCLILELLAIIPVALAQLSDKTIYDDTLWLYPPEFIAETKRRNCFYRCFASLCLGLPCATSSYTLPEYPRRRRAVSMPELLMLPNNHSLSNIDDFDKTEEVSNHVEIEENKKDLNAGEEFRDDSNFVPKSDTLMSDDLGKVEIEDKDTEDDCEVNVQGIEDDQFKEKGQKEDHEDTSKDILQYDAEKTDEGNDKIVEDGGNPKEFIGVIRQTAIPENDPTVATSPPMSKTENDSIDTTTPQTRKIKAVYQITKSPLYRLSDRSPYLDPLPRPARELPPIVSMNDYKSNKEIVRPKLEPLKTQKTKRKKQHSIKRTDTNVKDKSNDPKITTVEV